ncbi:MAG: AMP-binding protein, partial [Acidimicrobiia bacterium]|nr:AMP-binding protein [Acidimicrobiia bacterium]
MGRLRALALPADTLVPELQRAWDEGDTVAPIDLRLPPDARRQVLEALRPHELITLDGTTRLDDGLETGPDDALVVATSGTTGEPKGVVLTHQAVRASAEATSTALAVDPLHDRWLACLPLAHIGGLSVVTRALHTGVDVDVHQGFDAALVREAAARGATLVSLVPAVLDRLDVGVFRRVLLGGSAIPADRPANCVATYGMTETGSGVVYDGRALDGVDIRVVDGEVHVRGPMLLRCYRDGTVPLDADGWLPTGDAGALTDAGELRVFGRLGDVIVTGGEKVWPVAVERVLLTHPGVAEALVEGRPDPAWGAVVTAVIVGAGDAIPSLDELR